MRFKFSDEELAALADELAPLLADRLRLPVDDETDAFQSEQNSVPDEPVEDDPWAEPAQRQTPKQGQRSNSRQRPAQSRQSGNSGPPATGTKTDDVGKRWTFGKADAPDCFGNDNHDPSPAALVNGTGKNGKKYKAWACAYGFGDSWRDKCDLFDFDV
jgi:hypothetical protein